MVKSIAHMIDKATPINVIRFDVNLSPYLTQGNKANFKIDYDLGKSKTTGQNYLVIHWQLAEFDLFNNILINYFSEKVCTLNITHKHEDFVSLINYLNNYYFEIALDFEEKLPNIESFNFGDVTTLLNETAKRIVVSLTNLGAYHKHHHVELKTFKPTRPQRANKPIKKIIN